MKYTDTQVVFSEIPGEITLAINISNCPLRCKGCHSPELWEDVGTELTKEEVSDLIKKNTGITCVCFMGGDRNYLEIEELAQWVKNNFNLKTAWYSGREEIPSNLRKDLFNYVKFGSYIESLGGLNVKGTNQRLYRVEEKKECDLTWYTLEDITYKLQN